MSLGVPFVALLRVRCVGTLLRTFARQHPQSKNELQRSFFCDTIEDMNAILRLLREKREVSELRSSTKNGTVEKAFARRAKEIESLRQHDRGEKTITAPDIKHIVRTVQDSRR